MLPIIGFFKTFFDSFTLLYNFVSTPLKNIVSGIPIPWIGELTIMQLLAGSLVTFLGALLLVHFIRLFVGG